MASKVVFIFPFWLATLLCNAQFLSISQLENIAKNELTKAHHKDSIIQNGNLIKIRCYNDLDKNFSIVELNKSGRIMELNQLLIDDSLEGIGFTIHDDSSYNYSTRSPLAWITYSFYYDGSIEFIQHGDCWGKLLFSESYYQSGIIKSTVSIDKDNLATTFLYNEKGFLTEYGKRKDGKKVGEWKYYSRKGKLLKNVYHG